MQETNTKNLDNRLYDINGGSDSCGVGFITRKDGTPTHKLLQLGNEALCVVPHRGGMDAQGVGDGGGVLVDLSKKFFSKVAEQDLTLGKFGVGQFFFPNDEQTHKKITDTITNELSAKGITAIKWRSVPVDTAVVNQAAINKNPTIRQVIFTIDDNRSWQDFENDLITITENLGKTFYEDKPYEDFFPISISSRTIVYKGCLNSNEVIPFFNDLTDTDFEIKIFLFHTRYSTNTAPRPSMAQPFCRMAHNGELNTDKKNRIQEDSVLRTQNKRLITPIGQSDSARFDQTLARRLRDDNLNIIQAFTRMSPPAWENSPKITGDQRSMLEYFSLSEEKVDGPAALVFTDGIRIGAKLDRLGLRPLRETETTEYISVMSEAGQNIFNPDDVIARGKISAGDMIVYDHEQQLLFNANQVLDSLSQEQDYTGLLGDSIINLCDLPDNTDSINELNFPNTQIGRAVAYGHNAESFRFLVDPILETGAEKVSAMGYGLAINPLNSAEGGMSRYFLQRFAQVTNPPLDSIRESDGMSTRVSLGAKPTFSKDTKQLVIDSPILSVYDLQKIRSQNIININEIDALFTPDNDDKMNAKNLETALQDIAKQSIEFSKNNGIIILSDNNLQPNKAPIPITLAIASINKSLIDSARRFNTSIIVQSSQILSSHDVAVALGFGASAVCCVSVYERATELFPNDIKGALNRYKKGCEKALMKTMGKFGLCTVESYSGGEFFEGNFLDTKNDSVLSYYFPNIDSPIGGVGFETIAKSARDWFINGANNPTELPSLGLFKEKSDGAGHSYGVLATKEFINIATEDITYATDASKIPFGTWILDDHMAMAHEMLGDSNQYKEFGYEPLSPQQITDFKVTSDYREFSKNIMIERTNRPSALRDLLAMPLDVSSCNSEQDFINKLESYNWDSTLHATISGLPKSGEKLDWFNSAVKSLFGDSADKFLAKLQSAKDKIDINTVQSAQEICKTFASGAMSFGALNRNAHEAVALGTNLVGGYSNCGEGGEQYSRYNTPKSSSIKQIASGRFGVWAGYFADPNLREIEIKLAQGAKPGEGGQLPSKKVTVEIASMRGGTPMVELVSPPPHHDTYSIEDLAQLIHDAHCARVKVIVKLVSSEGIGTIAVGVAKAGADVINVAGGTGGTGAAQVTSLKNAGRIAELGIAEVHQALCDNGLRDKVILRNSGALQNGYDVIKSAILGADSFEFGTTALMMIGCVMAKNCNIKCPAGLTTDPEIFAGDGRALAQYFLNISGEIREILAHLGYTSLSEIRGQTDLLHMINHPDIVGNIDCRSLLNKVESIKLENPKYIQACYAKDDAIIDAVKHAILDSKTQTIFDYGDLNNCNKSVGGQTAIDIERLLSWQMEKPTACVDTTGKRPTLKPDTIVIKSAQSAGQSYGAFTTTGMKLIHTGVCNDGVGKSMCGGVIIIQNPGLNDNNKNTQNTLVGNFALFGATGGKVFINGGAGDRFGVRNTGALAVVDGVGDFACEYMINGTVMNLGEFGKGFGNGMSGGNAYQYDPSSELKLQHSKDSVCINRLNDNTEQSNYHIDIVKDILQQYIDATNSIKAKRILENWDNEIGNFYVIHPLAIYDTQCPDILSKVDTKSISDELIKGYTVSAVRSIKQSYKNNTDILGGKIPTDINSITSADLIIQFGLLAFAKTRAEKILAQSGATIDDYILDMTTKKLIITEDKDVLNDCNNALKSTMENIDSSVLGSWLSQKRIDDYCESLAGRDTLEIYNMGMIEWIKSTTAKNNDTILNYGSLQQHLQNNFVNSLAKNIGLDKMAINDTEILKVINNG